MKRALRIGFDRGVIVGYTAIVISCLFVYAGVKSYRDNVAGGRLSVGTGVVVGGLITLVSCVCCVIAWQVVYHAAPTFLEPFPVGAVVTLVSAWLLRKNPTPETRA